MKPLILFLAAAGFLALTVSCTGIKNPEKSSLFERRVDPESGVVSTASNADGHMDLYVTPVAQMIEMTQ